MKQKNKFKKKKKMLAVLAFLIGLVLMYNSAEKYVSEHPLNASHHAVCTVRAF